MNSSRSQSWSSASATSTANNQEKFAVVRQGNLFEGTSSVLPGSLNDAALIRATVTEAIRKSGKTRETIAEDMSRLTGTEVTVRRLNAFTAESREDYRFPSELIRAFCIATGNDGLLRNLAQLAGFHLVNETDFQLLQLGREYLKQKRANEKVALLEKGLSGVEL